jgi:hypothetical protein
VLALAIVACATAIQTDPIPPELKKSSLQYFVENHGKDSRGIDHMITREIRSRGLKVENGLASARPAELDVLVVYEDRWQWDMSNYLIFLRIDLRDPATNVLLATGSSYQTSGARKPEAEVVAQIIGGMFDKPWASSPRRLGTRAL